MIVQLVELVTHHARCSLVCHLSRRLLEHISKLIGDLEQYKSEKLRFEKPGAQKGKLPADGSTVDLSLTVYLYKLCGRFPRNHR